jgi:glycosyltransferase involved in cell wall biosynthesis
MKVTYLWTAPSGYLTACVAELVRRERCDVALLTRAVSSNAPFAELAEPWHRTLTPAEQGSYTALHAVVAQTKPDILVVAGWSQPGYARLFYDPAFSRVRIVLGADTPIRFDWRQFVARAKIGRLLRRADAVCVPGDRGYQVMRYWKVPEHKIYRLLYGIDYPLFAAAATVRQIANDSYPRAFLFAGRYVQAKGIDILLEAYRRYRDSVAEPWQLHCCGRGPLQNRLKDVAGVVDHGFQQPQDLAARFPEASVFVLPSQYEPWGQVIVEAAAAGMPVICSQACGAAPEVVRHLSNGLLVPTGDAAALADAFRWMHDHQPQVAEMGRASQHMARPFATDKWAENQELMFQQLLARQLPGRH